MADTIFGQGLDPVPLKLVQTPAVVPAFEAKARPVYIEGLGNVTATKGAAVANATVAADATSAATQLNALLASLRAAGIIAT